MVIVRTARFDEEADRFALRFCCEDCAYFEPAEGRCRHDWPTEAHRRVRYEAAAGTPAAAGQLSFCKEFEVP